MNLSFAAFPNPSNRPILDGSVAVEGINFKCTSISPSELFLRQLRFGEFDVSEMSLSSLLISIANGDTRYIGLPIFTTHRFYHTMILVRRNAGIDKPEDLKGKRLGVPEYQQTAALWARGILKHEFGVDQTDIEWWVERTEEHSHGEATGFKTPPNTTINQCIHKNIGEMILSGELDGTLLQFPHRQKNDRTSIDLANHPDIKTLFPDPVAEGVRYYKKTGMYPINHVMVIRRSIVEENPWTAINIFKAMVRANGLNTTEHGLKENLKEIKAVIQYSAEQSLTPRKLKLEEVFYTIDEDMGIPQ